MNKQEEKNAMYYDTFYGHKVSDYALEFGRLDYGTLSKCFDCILCNRIVEIDEFLFDNIVSGDLYSYYYDGEEIEQEEYEERLEEIENEIAALSIKNNYKKVERLEKEKEKFETIDNDVFQWFIVSDNALPLLKECNELVFYSELLDCYIWGVCHFGTSWDYVLTSLKLRKKGE